MHLMFNKHDQKFHQTLSNLIFSANNPFQSNFNYIVDQHYVKQEQAKFKQNYANITSIGYVVNQCHRQYVPSVEIAEE